MTKQPADLSGVRLQCCKCGSMIGDQISEGIHRNVCTGPMKVIWPDRPKPTATEGEIQPPARKDGMDVQTIYKFQLRTIENGLRMALNLTKGWQGDTAMDREMLRGYRFAQEALNATSAVGELVDAAERMELMTKTFAGYDDYSRTVPEGFTDARQQLQAALANVKAGKG